MRVWINGEARDVADGLTVAGLLTTLDLRAERIAVEVNTEVVRKAKHGEHPLVEGDRVEIVTFVGGG
ncbi:MAG: sulfur carrier protein ThiS [Myxococcaceae bacterium]